jgi:hypothetical protein
MDELGTEDAAPVAGVPDAVAPEDADAERSLVGPSAADGSSVAVVSPEADGDGHSMSLIREATDRAVVSVTSLVFDRAAVAPLSARRPAFRAAFDAW